MSTDDACQKGRSEKVYELHTKLGELTVEHERLFVLRVEVRDQIDKVQKEIDTLVGKGLDEYRARTEEADDAESVRTDTGSAASA